jgi:hypothetical protein
MGSVAIASWVAHLAFWILLLYGWWWDKLGPRGIVVFLFLWVAALFGLPYLPYGAALFLSFVAVLDIALVLVIFEGDVPLT